MMFSNRMKEVQGLDVSPEQKQKVKDVILIVELLKEFKREYKDVVLEDRFENLLRVNVSFLRAYDSLEKHTQATRFLIKEYVERVLNMVENTTDVIIEIMAF